jgi:hypothetical protein
MKRNNWRAPVSLLLLLAVLGVVFADAVALFGYPDISFVVVFLLYFGSILAQKRGSRISFVYALLILLIMTCSYVLIGVVKITERLGEWFYLFFVFGLIQYTREAWKKSKL